ncbi:hypothetical protein OPV22_028031 [Ensete ventricosum]|uniref:Uncharacterized protein n=1 Tax=Ensete ventricosum TaxID=4639 RepID=A0AAV8Q1X8_ENSVE|nr:hypothetical protein OPV22_028031 [Ensete ventricosum]
MHRSQVQRGRKKEVNASLKKHRLALFSYIRNTQLGVVDDKGSHAPGASGRIAAASRNRSGDSMILSALLGRELSLGESHGKDATVEDEQARLTDERLSDVEYGFRIIVSVRKNSVSISDVSPTELSQILNVQSIPTRTTLGSYHQISETPRSQTRNIRTTDMHCQGPRCGKCLGSHSDERDEDEEFHPPVQLLEVEEPGNTMSQNKSACLE